MAFSLYIPTFSQYMSIHHIFLAMEKNVPWTCLIGSFKAYNYGWFKWTELDWKHTCSVWSLSKSLGLKQNKKFYLIVSVLINRNLNMTDDKK